MNRLLSLIKVYVGNVLVVELGHQTKTRHGALTNFQTDVLLRESGGVIYASLAIIQNLFGDHKGWDDRKHHFVCNMFHEDPMVKEDYRIRLHNFSKQTAFAPLGEK